MAALSNSFKLAFKMAKTNPLLLQHATRTMAGWNKDYKPNPFPKTEKERAEAAKKYNLLPEEYETYPDEGFSYGDYPKLPTGLGVEAKDPFYPYDHPELKRNFNEPVHADVDLYSEDRFSQPSQPRFTHSQYWLSFLGVMTGFFALYYFLEDKKMYPSVAAKQYPISGKKHYTFELE